MKRKNDVNVRKEPIQKRSKSMNEDILQGAARVLAKYGATGFTTNKVAEETGISIGSFYQYYPNKESLLYQLHKIETTKSRLEIEKILDETTLSRKKRLEKVIEYFFESESNERELRKSLNIAAVFFQQTEEFKEIERQIFEKVKSFLSDFAEVKTENLDETTDVVITLVKSLAEEVTDRNLPESQIKKWADLCCKLVFNCLEILR